MQPCTPYQNHHHHSMVVTGSQRGRTCWPYRVKLMSNINVGITFSIMHGIIIPILCWYFINKNSGKTNKYSDF